MKKGFWCVYGVGLRCRDECWVGGLKDGTFVNITHIVWVYNYYVSENTCCILVIKIYKISIGQWYVRERRVDSYSIRAALKVPLLYGAISAELHAWFIINLISS
jgi:hypothetical protein